MADDVLFFFSRWSVPLGVVTSLIGGSAWLTTLHSNVDHLQAQSVTLRQELVEQRKGIEGQDQRLSRMEGKLDSILDFIARRRWEHQGGDVGR